jgi:predicted nucleic-acid-binding Zn-ribbon protein
MDGMDNVAPCPECGSRTLYRGPATSSGGGHAPDFLPGLGKFLFSARFVLVVCRDCGLTRFFAQPEARAKLKDAKKWKTV